MFPSLLEYFTYLLPFEFCRKLDKNSIFLPSYHTVSDRQLDYVKPLYFYRSTHQFEKEIDFFLKHYKAISLSELDHYSAEKPAFHLSFDDGMRSCHETIMPILLRKGISATFFINNNFVDNKGLFYRFKTILILNKIKTDPEALRFACNYLSIKPQYKIAAQTLLSYDHTQNAAFNNIGKGIGIDYSKFLSSEQPYMSTAQIKDLLNKGFTIGAHSQFHPKYQSLSIESQILETQSSIERLKHDFDLNYTAFAFPFNDYGITEEFFTQIRGIYPNIQLFGSKGVVAHRSRYYNRYIMELHAQRSPLLALKYLYAKLLLK